MDLNRKKKSSLYTKAAAAVTAFVFLFTSMAPAQMILQPVLPTFISQPSIQIPQEIGNILDSFSASEKSPSVFLIQDAHDSLDAQENIRLILKHLVEKENVSAVCFEGGSQELNRPFYNFSKNIQTNPKIWDALFKEGEIGGVERYALEAPSRIKFFGIEDSKTYFENIHSIQKSYEVSDKAQSSIRNKDAEFSARAGRLLSGDVKKFRDLKNAFEQKRIDLKRYAKQLSKWAPEISDSANQREWPQLVRLMKISEISSKLDTGKIKIPSNLKKLTDSTLTKGHLRWHIERLAEEGFNFEKNPQLNDWIGFQILQDELSASQLFEEVERLEKQILNHMKISDEARKFFEEEHDWQLIKKLISLQLTRREWEEAEKLQFAGLTQTARNNYRIVEARDQFLAGNTLNRIHNLKLKKTALVVGGFHAEKMASFFKANNISYTIINPAIKNPDRKLNYRSRISPPDQTSPVVVGASLGIPDAQPFIHHLVVKASSLGESPVLERYFEKLEYASIPREAVGLGRWDDSPLKQCTWNANNRNDLDEWLNSIEEKSKRERENDGLANFLNVGTNIDEGLGLLSFGDANRSVIISTNPVDLLISLPIIGILLRRCETRAEFIAALYGKRILPQRIAMLRDRKLKEDNPKKKRRPGNSKPLRKDDYVLVSLDEILKEVAKTAPISSAEIDQINLGIAYEIERYIPKSGDLFVPREVIQREVDRFFEAISDGDSSDIFRFAGSSWLSSDGKYNTVRDRWLAGKIDGIIGNIWGDALKNEMEQVNKSRDALLFLSVSSMKLDAQWSFEKRKRFRDRVFPQQNSAFVISDTGITRLNEYIANAAGGNSLGNETVDKVVAPPQLVVAPEVRLVSKIKKSWKREIVVFLKPWAVSGVFATNEWYGAAKHSPVVERKNPTDLEIFRGIIDKWFPSQAKSLGDDTERVHQVAERLAHLPVFYFNFDPIKKEVGALSQKAAGEKDFPLPGTTRLEIARQLEPEEVPVGILEDSTPWARGYTFLLKYYFLLMKDGSVLLFHEIGKEHGDNINLEFKRGHLRITGPGTTSNNEQALEIQKRAESLREAISNTGLSIQFMKVVEESASYAQSKWRDTKKLAKKSDRQTRGDGSSLGHEWEDDALQFVGRVAQDIKYRASKEERARLAEGLRQGSLSPDHVAKELKALKTEYENRVRLDAGWFVGGSLGKKDETDPITETSATISKIHSIIHRLWIAERKSAYTDLWISAYEAGIVSEKPDIKGYLQSLKDKGKPDKYAQTLIHAVKSGIVTQEDSIQYFLRSLSLHDWYEAHAEASLRLMEMGALKDVPPELVRTLAQLDKKGGPSAFPKIYVKAYRLGVLKTPVFSMKELHPEFLVAAYGAGIIPDKPNLNGYFVLLEKNKAWKIYAETLLDALEFGIISDIKEIKRHIHKLKEEDLPLYAAQVELKAYQLKLSSEKPQLDHLYKELEMGGLWDTYAEMTSLALEAGCYPIHPTALQELKSSSKQSGLPISLVNASMTGGREFFAMAASMLQSVSDKNLAELDSERKIDEGIFREFLSGALPHLNAISPALTKYILDQYLNRTGQLLLLQEIFEEFAFLDAEKISVLKDFYQKTGNRFENNPDFLMTLAGYLNVYPELGFSPEDFRKDLGSGEETMQEILGRLGRKVMTSVAMQLGVAVGPNDLKDMPGFLDGGWDFRYFGRLISYRAFWKDDQKKLFNLLMLASLKGKQNALLNPAHYSDEPDNFLGEENRQWVRRIRRHNLNFLKQLEDAGINVNIWLDPSREVTPITVNENGKETSYRIRFWNRDFSREMFLGNYANSCVSLGRGSASFFQMFPDLGTHFVVIEDMRGRIKGYARFFLSKNDVGRFAIYIDTISGAAAKKYQNEMISFVNQFADEAGGIDGGVLNRTWHISSKVGGSLAANYFHHSMAKIEVSESHPSVDTWQPVSGWQAVETFSGASLGQKSKIGSTTLQIRLHVASEIEAVERSSWKDYEIAFEKSPTADSIITGRPGEYWFHLHLRKVGPNPPPPGNGLLFKIQNGGDKIILSEPMAEMDMDRGNNDLPLVFVPLKNLVSDLAIQHLTETAARTLQKRKSVIIQAMDKHAKKQLDLKHVLARAVTPSLKGTWDILKARQFGKNRRTGDGGITFERLDLASVAASLGRKKSDYDVDTKHGRINIVDQIAAGNFEKFPDFRNEVLSKFVPKNEKPFKRTKVNSEFKYLPLENAVDVYMQHNPRGISREIARKLIQSKLKPYLGEKLVKREDLESLIDSVGQVDAAKYLRTASEQIKKAALRENFPIVARMTFIPVDWLESEKLRLHQSIPLRLFTDVLISHGYDVNFLSMSQFVENPKKYFPRDFLDQYFSDRENLYELTSGGSRYHGSESALAISLDTAWKLAIVLKKLKWDQTSDLAKKLGEGDSFIRDLIEREDKRPGTGIKAEPFADIKTRNPEWRISPEESERVVKLFDAKAREYQTSIGDLVGVKINSWKQLMELLSSNKFLTATKLKKRWDFGTRGAVYRIAERGSLTSVPIRSPYSKEDAFYVYTKDPKFLAFDGSNQEKFKRVSEFVSGHSESKKPIRTLKQLKKELNQNWYTFKELCEQSGSTIDEVYYWAEKLGNKFYIKVDLLGWKTGVNYVIPAVAREWIETRQKTTAAQGASLGTATLFLNTASKNVLLQRLPQIPGIRAKSAEIIAEAITRRRLFANLQDLEKKLTDTHFDPQKPGSFSATTIEALKAGVANGLVGFDALDLNSANREKLTEGLSKISGIAPYLLPFLVDVILEQRPFTRENIRKKLSVSREIKLEDGIVKTLVQNVEKGLPLFDLNAGSDSKLTSLLDRLPEIPKSEIPFIVRFIKSRRAFTKNNAAQKFSESYPLKLDDNSLNALVEAVEAEQISLILFDINNVSAETLKDRLTMIGIPEQELKRTTEIIIKRRPFTRIDIEKRISIPENGLGSLDSGVIKVILEVIDNGQVTLKKYRGGSKLEIPEVRRELAESSFTYPGQPKFLIPNDGRFVKRILLANGTAADWQLAYQEMRKFSDAVKYREPNGRLPVILYLSGLPRLSLSDLIKKWEGEGYAEGLRIRDEMKNPSILLRDILADPQNADFKKRLEEDWRETRIKADQFMQILDGITTAESPQRRLAELKKRESDQTRAGLCYLNDFVCSDIVRWGIEFGVKFQKEETTFEDFVESCDSSRMNWYIFRQLSFNDLEGADFYCNLEFRRKAENIYRENKSSWRNLTELQSRFKAKSPVIFLPIVLNQYAGFEVEGLAGLETLKNEKGDYPSCFGMAREFSGVLQGEERYAYMWAQTIRFALVELVPDMEWYDKRVVIATEVLRRMHSKKISIKSIVEKWGARLLAKRKSDVVFDDSLLMRDVHNALLNILIEEDLVTAKEMNFLRVRGASLGTPYGISDRTIRLVGKMTRKIYGTDLRQVDPKLFERILAEEFSSKLPAVQFPEFIKTKESALVITGPVSPEAVLAQISSGKTVVVHYSDDEYKKRFDAQAARAVELGVLTQDQLKKHAHLADLSFAGLSEFQFYEKLLKGERIGNLRSLNWIKQQAGLVSSDPVVWMAKDSVIDAVSKKLIPGTAMPFVDQYLVDASVKDRILYDIERLALAVKLSRGAEELKSQGLIIFKNGRYSQTDRFLQSFLGNAILEQQVAKLIAVMA